MSNQTISMSRELAELCFRNLNGGDNQLTGMEHGQAFRELRALLAKPAEPTKSECPHCLGDSMFGCAECEPDDLGQHQGEPVYMVRTHGSCCWEEVGSGSLEDFQSMPDEYELRALYTCPAEQSEPVSSTSDKYKAELYDEVWQLARDMGFGNVTDALMKLNKQTAPVAVVLPERIDESICRGHSLTLAIKWNRCLDEVARLNPPQQ